MQENAALRARLALLRAERRSTTRLPVGFARSKAAVKTLQTLIGEESEARATCYELVGMCVMSEAFSFLLFALLFCCFSHISSFLLLMIL